MSTGSCGLEIDRDSKLLDLLAVLLEDDGWDVDADQTTIAYSCNHQRDNRGQEHEVANIKFDHSNFEVD